MMEILLAAATIVIPLLGLLATPAGLPVLSWLIGSPVGRVIALVGLAIAAVYLAFLIGRREGVTRVTAQAAQKNIDALRDRIVVDEEIRSMSADKRREELRNGFADPSRRHVARLRRHRRLRHHRR